MSMNKLRDCVMFGQDPKDVFDFKFALLASEAVLNKTQVTHLVTAIPASVAYTKDQFKMWIENVRIGREIWTNLQDL